jgi:hypothetical protein
MVVAAFSVDVSARKPVEISFALAPAAAFDGVAYISA